LSCDAGLTLSENTGDCQIPATDRSIYQEMFTDLHLINKTDILTNWKKYNVSSTTQLANSDIIGCCNPSANGYFNFDLVGLFNSSFAILR
jgi:hypothetical protein